MRIAQLIAALKMAEARLRAAIQLGAPTEVATKHLRRAAALMEAMETYDPREAEERRTQIEFFVRRASLAEPSSAPERDMEIALRLLNRHRSNAVPASSQPVIEGDWLAEYVAGAADRVVAIDRRYRYLATSLSNAAFNGSTQVRMTSRHMAEVIGGARFEVRARKRVDRCLDGTAQDYFYELETTVPGQRIIRCRMSPVRDVTDRVWCAMLHLHDITPDAPQGPPGHRAPVRPDA